jgi:phosphoenolpyruvate carboxylase
MTEQGEVIAQKYNNYLTAAHNLELLLAGSLGASLLAEGKVYPKELGRAMDQLHESSRRTYSSLLETRGFIDFFRQATPIDALENSAIGSRPSRRSGQSGLRDLRAIPWVFSWNQSRFFLPGWYGVGSALEELQGSDPSLYRLMKENWMNWPFLRYLLYNIESSLESASVEWMKAYGRLVPSTSLRTHFLEQIVGEYNVTRRHLEIIMGIPLRKRRPRFFKTLHYRDEWLALLHAEQIRRLRRWRQSGSKEDLVDVLQSINAVAAGLRTTG